MAQRAQISAKLRGNMRNWVDDRIDNRESLMLQSFFTFMKELEFEIGPKMRVTIANSMRKEYAKRKR